MRMCFNNSHWHGCVHIEYEAAREDYKVLKGKSQLWTVEMRGRGEGLSAREVYRNSKCCLCRGECFAPYHLSYGNKKRTRPHKSILVWKWLPQILCDWESRRWNKNLLQWKQFPFELYVVLWPPPRVVLRGQGWSLASLALHLDSLLVFFFHGMPGSVSNLH